MKKIMFIVAHLVPDPEAYEGKTNEDVEKEIFDELQKQAVPVIPYVAHVEKVTVLDCP
jgi:hypothetical protein